jgi:hypothetical protein
MTLKQREIIISIADGDERAEVDFAYDATVVLAIKKLNPINRNYHDTGDKKFWTVDVICLTDLVHHLLEDLQGKLQSPILSLLRDLLIFTRREDPERTSGVDERSHRQALRF